MTITHSGPSTSAQRWAFVPTLAVLPSFTACGGSSGAPADDDTIGTLAYVQSSCEESGGEFHFSLIRGHGQDGFTELPGPCGYGPHP